MSAVTLGDSQCQRWAGTGGHRALEPRQFGRLPTAFQIVDGAVDLPTHDVVSVQRVRCSAPGIAVAANVLHSLEAA
ncbi:hypothetical protein ACP93_15315 [Xanthomonas sp. NCPPB 1128]|uniref:hypothetical protein n=1 Tax=Xanthomonas sp. NCPPB 1128 TaxID=1775876 RepID=UPI00065AF232|nr:hypothetical protein [Xanthomonas sp. NCPPB 1128]KMM74644.1 hypothetical protein ACP93_15315 [Xanthomonas sp. NCPPB 1128]